MEGVINLLSLQDDSHMSFVTTHYINMQLYCSSLHNSFVISCYITCYFPLHSTCVLHLYIMAVLLLIE